MKTHLLRISIAVAIAAAAAYPQSVSPLLANVPFNFVAGQKTLPAGEYFVDSRTIPGMVILKPVWQKEAAIVRGVGLEVRGPERSPKLVFHRYGNAYFLSQIWGEANHGRQIDMTKQEREIAARGSTPDTAIAALH
jgi:hypothetical protein